MKAPTRAGSGCSLKGRGALLCFLVVLGACSPQTHIVGSGERDGAAVPSVDGAGEAATNQDGPSAKDVSSSSTGTDVQSADSAIHEGNVDAPEPVAVLAADAGAKPEIDTGVAGSPADGPLPVGDSAGEVSRLDVTQDRPEEIETPTVDAISAKDSSTPVDAIPDAGNSDGPLVCPTGGVMPGGTDHCPMNSSGVVGNLEWRLFYSTGNPACLTTYDVNPAFSVSWNNSGDVLAQLGPSLDGTKSHSELGTIAADFAETKSGSAGGFSYIGIYGWSTSPTREFYIVEDWFGAPKLGGSKLATIIVDGAPYDVYRFTRVGAAPTSPNQTFDQYFSVRQSPRSCGHISVTEHFRRWEALGLTLGAIWSLKILAEVGGGAGRVDFSTATISIQ